MDWILHPGISYLLLVVGGGTCLFLFRSMRREIRAVELRSAKELDTFAIECRMRLESMERQCAEALDRSQQLVPPIPPRSGLNLNKRSHALDMLRRGDSVDRIATVLAVPRGEIELLVKMQRIALS